MTPLVNSFDVRKFSEKNLVTGRWTHYPQRSEISVNFLLDNEKVILSITWRTLTWVSTYCKAAVDKLTNIIETIEFTQRSEPHDFGICKVPICRVQAM